MTDSLLDRLEALTKTMPPNLQASLRRQIAKALADARRVDAAFTQLPQDVDAARLLAIADELVRVNEALLRAIEAATVAKQKR